MLKFKHINYIISEVIYTEHAIELKIRLFCQSLTEVVVRPILEEISGCENELTQAQYICMRYIHLHRLPSIGEIAVGLDISNAAATKLVNRLVLKKLVKRKDDANDRRVLQLSLTEKGERIVKAIRECESERLNEIYSRMSAEGKKAFCQGLESFLVAALTEKELVDRVCLRCGTNHISDCAGNRVYRGLTGEDKTRV